MRVIQSLVEESKEEEKKCGSSRHSKELQQKRRLRRIQDLVESNRQSIANMKPEESKKICAICHSDMTPETLSTLEACNHQFCFECIKQWGTSCANTCPLCKKRFNSIKYFDLETKQLKNHNILNRNYTSQQDNAVLVQIDDSMDFCYICNTDRDPHLMMICDVCDYMVAHTYCVGMS